MAENPKAPRAPIALSQTEVNALIGGRREAIRALSRRLKAATPSKAPAEGGQRTEKSVPIAITRPELRALAAGKPMTAAVRKRLDAAGREAHDIERRRSTSKKKEGAEQPSRKPYA